MALNTLTLNGIEYVESIELIRAQVDISILQGKLKQRDKRLRCVKAAYRRRIRAYRELLFSYKSAIREIRE